MLYHVRLSEQANADLKAIHDYRADQSSSLTAQRYMRRLSRVIDDLELFPKRGTLRHDFGPNIRTIGFERRISIAFVVGDDEVFILRILYAGKGFDDAEV